MTETTIPILNVTKKYTVRMSRIMKDYDGSACKIRRKVDSEEDKKVRGVKSGSVDLGLKS